MWTDRDPVRSTRFTRTSILYEEVLRTFTELILNWLAKGEGHTLDLVTNVPHSIGGSGVGVEGHEGEVGVWTGRKL